jgi:hypothetical protein
LGIVHPRRRQPAPFDRLVPGRIGDVHREWKAGVETRPGGDPTDSLDKTGWLIVVGVFVALVVDGMDLQMLALALPSISKASDGGRFSSARSCRASGALILLWGLPDPASWAAARRTLERGAARTSAFAELWGNPTLRRTFVLWTLTSMLSSSCTTARTPGCRVIW